MVSILEYSANKNIVLIHYATLLYLDSNFLPLQHILIILHTLCFLIYYWCITIFCLSFHDYLLPQRLFYRSHWKLVTVRLLVTVWSSPQHYLSISILLPHCFVYILIYKNIYIHNIHTYISMIYMYRYTQILCICILFTTMNNKKSILEQTSHHMLCSKTLEGSVKIRDPSGTAGRRLLWWLCCILLFLLRHKAENLVMKFILFRDLKTQLTQITVLL